MPRPVDLVYASNLLEGCNKVIQSSALLTACAEKTLCPSKLCEQILALQSVWGSSVRLPDPDSRQGINVLTSLVDACQKSLSGWQHVH